MSSADAETAKRSAPLIVLVHRADRELQGDMVRQARAAGHERARSAHNAVFSTLPLDGARSADLAARAGVTRQSMGEVVRELVELGVVEMAPDPKDRRAKLVTYTDAGLRQVREGRAHLDAFERRMRAELGPDGYDALRHGLERIVQVLRDDAGGDRQST
jgi:DNA-binding MarR family transcriptional regulator